MANRKISDLTSLTAPATGDLLPIVDISEVTAVNKNKKITYGELLASAPAGTAAAPSFSFDGDPNTGIYNPGADTLAFVKGAAEAMRIDSGGRLLKGTSSAFSVGSIPGAQISSTVTTNGAHLNVSRFGNDTGNSILSFGKSRSGVNAATGGLVLNDDNIGTIDFRADNGIDFSGQAAYISGVVDGTASATSMPGQLVFATTAAGVLSSVARMIIDSSGRVLVGTSTARSNFFGTTLSAVTQTEGTGGASGRGALSVINNDVNNNPPYVLLGRSGAASLGSNAAVVSGSRLGTLTFHGADGTSFIEAATVAGEVDGTPGTNDMPGRLVFSTTSDGAASPTERFRVTSTGRLGLATAAPAATAHIAGDTIISNVDVANATYDSISFSVATEETNPVGLFFSPDGRKMFVTGSTGDDINEYTLSTPWNVSTATYITIFSVAAQDSAPQDLYFRNDGKKLYVVGSNNDAVFQYTLTTPWSIASASYDSVSFSVTTQESGSTGLFFKPDGLAFYIVGTNTDTVYRYNLTTAWNISTATFANSFSVSAQEASPHAVSFTADGSRMFVLGSTGDDINIYNLTTPWDVTTAIFVTVFSVAAQGTAPTGLFVKPDGTKFYFVDATADAVFQYTIPSATIDLTGTAKINGSAEIAQDLVVRGSIFSPTAETFALSTSGSERFRITSDGIITHAQQAPAAVNATATLTIANLKAGIITSTSAAATDMTLPTGTDTQAGFSDTYNNFTFEWSVINTGPSLVRVLAGTAHTVVGSGSVATGTSGRFASRRTAANTFVSYRLA